VKLVSLYFFNFRRKKRGFVTLNS